MTEDEIIGMLRHSSLPCLLVEGKDDMYIYSWCAASHMHADALLVPCGSRNTLLAIYRRRQEYNGKKIAFLADRDMWLYSGIPDEFRGIVFTRGYSIENDVLCSTAVTRLLAAEERRQFASILKELAKWFAREVSEYLAGRTALVDLHINQIMPPGATTLRTDIESIRGYQGTPSPAIIKLVNGNPRLNVRGKNVLQLLVRITSSHKRPAKYNASSILEIAVKFGRSRYLKNLNTAISQFIN